MYLYTISHFSEFYLYTAEKVSWIWIRLRKRLCTLNIEHWATGILCSDKASNTSEIKYNFIEFPKIWKTAILMFYISMKLTLVFFMNDIDCYLDFTTQVVHNLQLAIDMFREKIHFYNFPFLKSFTWTPGYQLGKCFIRGEHHGDPFTQKWTKKTEQVGFNLSEVRDGSEDRKEECSRDKKTLPMMKKKERLRERIWKLCSKDYVRRLKCQN